MSENGVLFMKWVFGRFRVLSYKIFFVKFSFMFIRRNDKNQYHSFSLKNHFETLKSFLKAIIRTSIQFKGPSFPQTSKFVCLFFFSKSNNRSRLSEQWNGLLFLQQKLCITCPLSKGFHSQEKYF